MFSLPLPVVVVGLGELGGVFSRGLLKCGHPVVPVLRDSPVEELAARYPEPELVLVTVAEDDLSPVLERLPLAWRTRVGLVQNELLPGSWRAAEIEEPTVAVVWFEKKAGRPVHEVLPTVLAGPRAELLAGALRALDIDARTIDTEAHRGGAGEQAALLHELVAKNLYILVLNLAGLEVEGTAGDLLAVHRELLDTLARETLALQRALVGPEQARALDERRLIEALEAAIASDPAHGCAGRSAPRRLERNLALARELGLELPTYERLARRHLGERPPSRPAP